MTDDVFKEADELAIAVIASISRKYHKIGIGSRFTEQLEWSIKSEYIKLVRRKAARVAEMQAVMRAVKLDMRRAKQAAYIEAENERLGVPEEVEMSNGG